MYGKLYGVKIGVILHATSFSFQKRKVAWSQATFHTLLLMFLQHRRIIFFFGAFSRLCRIFYLFKISKVDFLALKPDGSAPLLLAFVPVDALQSPPCTPDLPPMPGVLRCEGSAPQLSSSCRWPGLLVCRFAAQGRPAGPVPPASDGWQDTFPGSRCSVGRYPGGAM